MTHTQRKSVCFQGAHVVIVLDMKHEMNAWYMLRVATGTWYLGTGSVFVLVAGVPWK